MSGWDTAGWLDSGHADKADMHVTSISEKVIEDKAMKAVAKNDAEHYKIVRDLNDLCPIPEEGERWHIITEKRFNAYAFILSLLERGDIDELWLAIYRINEPTSRSLIQLCREGRIKDGGFIISDFFNNNGRAEKWAHILADYCRESGRHFAFLHNHAKVCLVRVGDACYIFEGSGNMSDNARIEQYTYERNAVVFEFHKEWMHRLIVEYENRYNEGV